MLRLASKGMVRNSGRLETDVKSKAPASSGYVMYWTIEATSRGLMGLDWDYFGHRSTSFHPRCHSYGGLRPFTPINVASFIDGPASGTIDTRVRSSRRCRKNYLRFRSHLLGRHSLRSRSQVNKRPELHHSSQTARTAYALLAEQSCIHTHNAHPRTSHVRS